MRFAALTLLALAQTGLAFAVNPDLPTTVSFGEHNESTPSTWVQHTSAITSSSNEERESVGTRLKAAMEELGTILTSFKEGEDENVEAELAAMKNIYKPSKLKQGRPNHGFLCTDASILDLDDIGDIMKLKKLWTVINDYNEKHSTAVTVVRALEERFRDLPLAFKLYDLMLSVDNDVVKVATLLQEAQIWGWVNRNKKVFYILEIKNGKPTILPPAKNMIIAQKYISMVNEVTKQHDSLRLLLSAKYGEDKLLRMLVSTQKSLRRFNAREIATEMQNEILREWLEKGFQPNTAFKNLNTEEVATFLKTSDNRLVNEAYPGIVLKKRKSRKK